VKLRWKKNEGLKRVKEIKKRTFFRKEGFIQERVCEMTGFTKCSFQGGESSNSFFISSKNPISINISPFLSASRYTLSILLYFMFSSLYATKHTK